MARERGRHATWQEQEGGWGGSRVEKVCWGGRKNGSGEWNGRGRVLEKRVDEEGGKIVNARALVGEFRGQKPRREF